MKITPGNWTVSEIVPGAIVSEDNPRENILGLKEYDDGEVYAIVPNPADAALIAAAPAMLDLLQHLVVHPGFATVFKNSTTLITMKRVLAKATGS